MKKNEKTSTVNHGMIWFGAGISIAEILTGTFLAPLGLVRGLTAIILGHLIGGAIFFLAGYMGARTEKSAMETVKMSFGQKGSVLFSLLNILQLAGWTAIMIYDGALAATGLFSVPAWIWELVIGILIIVWILVGITRIGKLNFIAVSLLFALTVVLSIAIFRGGISPAVSESAGGGITFGLALELSVTMPLSWLPLISDYTRYAKKPLKATAVSTVSYITVSSWMYLIGLGAALTLSDSSAASIIGKIGFGAAGLVIILLATVTTTFLDAYSAGVSSVSIWEKINEKWAAIVITVIGTGAALLFPMDDFTGFLYLIGSVFAPMAAIMIADHYIWKVNSFSKELNLQNLIIWVLGFAAYRWLLTVDTPIGSTLPDVFFTIGLCIAAGLFRKARAAVRTRPADTMTDEMEIN